MRGKPRQGEGGRRREGGDDGIVMSEGLSERGMRAYGEREN